MSIIRIPSQVPTDIWYVMSKWFDRYGIHFMCTCKQLYEYYKRVIYRPLLDPYIVEIQNVVENINQLGYYFKTEQAKHQEYDYKQASLIIYKYTIDESRKIQYAIIDLIRSVIEMEILNGRYKWGCIYYPPCSFMYYLQTGREPIEFTNSDLLYTMIGVGQYQILYYSWVLKDRSTETFLQYIKEGKKVDSSLLQMKDLVLEIFSQYKSSIEDLILKVIRCIVIKNLIDDSMNIMICKQSAKLSFSIQSITDQVVKTDTIEPFIQYVFWRYLYRKANNIKSSLDKTLDMIEVPDEIQFMFK